MSFHDTLSTGRYPPQELKLLGLLPMISGHCPCVTSVRCIRNARVMFTVWDGALVRPPLVLPIWKVPPVSGRTDRSPKPTPNSSPAGAAPSAGTGPRTQTAFPPTGAPPRKKKRQPFPPVNAPGGTQRFPDPPAPRPPSTQEACNVMLRIRFRRYSFDQQPDEGPPPDGG